MWYSYFQDYQKISLQFSFVVAAYPNFCILVIIALLNEYRNVSDASILWDSFEEHQNKYFFKDGIEFRLSSSSCPELLGDLCLSFQTCCLLLICSCFLFNLSSWSIYRTFMCRNLFISSTFPSFCEYVFSKYYSMIFWISV